MKARLAALAIGGALALTIGGAGAPATTTAPPAAADNRAIVTDFARLFYTERNVKAAFERYVAPGYVQHNPDLPDGRDGAVGMLTRLFGMPGARFEVKRIVVDGDMAVIHVHGRPDPRGKGVAVADFYRLSNGRIVEHWDVVQPIPDKVVSAHPFF